MNLVDMISNVKKLPLILFVVFISLLLLSRFVWLDKSARFTRDESSDLARMHEYWSSKKVTLVGPISNDNVKVFSSLTYYMLMPFAVIGDFDPVSPVWGTAFFGLLSALLLFLFVKKTNSSLIILAGILLIIWYPLLLTSRWAWNPHLVPFWIALAIWSYSRKELLWSVVLGLSLGLSVHNHYVALISAVIFLLMVVIQRWRNKNLRAIAASLGGFIFAFLPFVLFDLRHPPGLFLRSYLLSSQPNIETTISASQLFIRFMKNIQITMETLAPGAVSMWMLGILLILLVLLEIKRKQFQLLQWLAPIVGLVSAGVFLDGFHERYVVGITPFFFAYLFQQRTGLLKLFQLVLITILVINSTMQLPVLLSKPQVPPSIIIIREASNYINKTIKSNPEIKNANVTVDMSEDMDMLATKYRDYLSIRGVQFKAASEYDTSEHLFVISQETESRLRESESFPLKVFSKQKVNDIHEIPQSDWRVVWFSY